MLVRGEGEDGDRHGSRASSLLLLVLDSTDAMVHRIVIVSKLRKAAPARYATLSPDPNGHVSSAG